MFDFSPLGFLCHLKSSKSLLIDYEPMNLQKSMCYRVKFLPMAALVQTGSILMTEYSNVAMAPGVGSCCLWWGKI